MKRLAITFAVVVGALGVVPAVANGARTQVVRPSVVKPSVVKPSVARPYVVRPDVVRTAIVRQVWFGTSIQIVRVHGL